MHPRTGLGPPDTVLQGTAREDKIRSRTAQKSPETVTEHKSSKLDRIYMNYSMLPMLACRCPDQEL